jgi:hypothetical protein
MTNIERHIAEEILRGSGWSPSNLGLRFDRVVVRVFGALRSFVETAAPTGGTILVALSAPIRSPAKTVDDLKQAITALPTSGTAGAGQSLIIQGNRLRMRRIEPLSGRFTPFIGFAHNAELDPDPLLDLAEHWLGVPAPAPASQSRRQGS